MTRATLTLATALLVAGGLATAATSSTSIPTSTANARAVQVTGAAMKGVSYTVVAGTVTALTVQLTGSHPLATVTARYGSGLAVPCVVGLYSVGTDSTPVTCTGFAESAARPRSLAIAVS